MPSRDTLLAVAVLGAPSSKDGVSLLVARLRSLVDAMRVEFFQDIRPPEPDGPTDPNERQPLLVHPEIYRALTDA
jgi:hypothetical protein